MDDVKYSCTNIHKLNHVQAVQWTAFCATASIPSPLGLPSGAATASRKLCLVERELRHLGYFVCYDSSSGILLLYILDAPTNHNDEKPWQTYESVLEKASRHGLRKRISGTLRASNLESFPKTSGSSVTSTGKRKRAPSGDAKEVDQDIDPLHASAHARDALPALNAEYSFRDEVIYDQFLVALTLTIKHFLIRQGSYVPVSTGSIALHGPLLKLSKTSAASKTRRAASDDPLNLAVTWTPDGCLLVSAYFDHCQQEPLVTSKTHELSGIVQLAPFNWTGTITEHATPMNHQHRKLRRVRREDSIAILDRQGVEVAEDASWNVVSVLLVSTSLPNEILIEWPCTLCIFKNERQPRPPRNSEDFNFSDPLARAELWYQDREARKGLVDAQKQELLAAQASHQSKSAKDYSEIFDLNSKKTLLDLQNAARIYPTPPDGNKFQPSGQTTDSIGANLLPSEEGQVPQTNQRKDSRSDSSSLMKHSIKAEDYDKFEDGGLFEDLGRTMDTENGITEADFSFFDEPDHPSLLVTQPIEMQKNDVPTPADESSVNDHDASLAMADGSVETHSLNQVSARATPEAERSSRMELEALETPFAGVVPSNDVSLQVEKVERLSQPLSQEATFVGQGIPGLVDEKYLTGKFDPGRSNASERDSRPGNLPPVLEAIPKLEEQWRNTDTQNDDLSDSESNSSSVRIEDEVTDQISSRRAAKSKVDCKKCECPISTPSQVGSIWTGSPSEFDSTECTSLDSLITLLEGSDGSRSGKDGPPTHGAKAWQIESFQTEEKRNQLAQLVAEQSVYFLSLSALASDLCADQTRTISNDPISSTMSMLLPSSERCTLLNCACFGTKHMAQPSARSTSSSLSKDSDSGQWRNDLGPSGSTSHLPLPDFRVRRGTLNVDLSPTALGFWEELGLSPRRGEKEAVAVCVCPDMESWRRGSSTFLTTLSSTYQSLRLGGFAVGHSSLGNLSSGLAYYPLMSKPDGVLGQDIETVCKQIGESLKALANSEKAIVVHMISQTMGSTSLQSLCAMFLKISEAYATGLRPTQSPSQLILQAIPSNWVVSDQTISIQPPARYVRLANIIYDKCPIQSLDSLIHLSPYATGSLYELSPQVSSGLDLRLSTGAAPSASEHSSAVHVGYSWRPGMHWLVCAITDDLGCHSWMAPYYVGNQPNPWTIFRAIATDIWDVVLELMGSGRNACTAVIGKESRMSEQETKSEVDTPLRRQQLTFIVWTALSSKVKRIFVCVDENPLVQVLGQVAPAVGLEPDQALTPQPLTPEVASPDVSGIRAVEEELTGRLVDQHNEYHAMVANRILANGDDGLELRNSVACAYLVRGGGEAVISVEVTLAERGCDFKELLGSLHGLCMLTRARALDSELPWHLAVTKKAAAALGDLD